MNQFDFVAFRRVNEGKYRASGSGGRAVGKLQAVFGQVLAEFLKAVHLEREMGEVGLHLHRAAAGKIRDFDLLLAAGRLEKNEFRAARRFVPPDFLEAQHVAVKFHRAFQIVHAIARVQQFRDLAHARNLSVQCPMSNVQCRLRIV